MPKVSFENISYVLVEQLPPRVKDVVEERFGLRAKDAQTLEAVGKEHQITRERVRQIVEEGLRLLRENIKQTKYRELIAATFERVAATLRKAGSMKREDLLLELLEAREAANYALFLLTLGDRFYHQRETQNFYPFWALKEDMIKKARPLHDRLLAFFQKKKAPVKEQELQALHGKETPLYLEVSKLIEKSHDGRWGLRRWPEVNPRGMRDKAYLVLRQEGKPLHFKEVTSLIAKLQDKLAQHQSCLGAGFALQRKKSALPQTVHNELIKDPRFVLIGRGTYGLADWGLETGTVKDVMRAILRNNGKTMNREQLIAQTLGQRKVQESTVLLNLQDQRYFTRNQNGTYSLRL